MVLVAVCQVGFNRKDQFARRSSILEGNFIAALER